MVAVGKVVFSDGGYWSGMTDEVGLLGVIQSRDQPVDTFLSNSNSEQHVLRLVVGSEKGQILYTGGHNCRTCFVGHKRDSMPIALAACAQVAACLMRTEYCGG